jgi:hypothetical protein
MNSKLWIRKALSSCLIVALVATYSMVALAKSDRIAGELSVTGKSVDGVTVNGELARSGRAIFSSSTITTLDDAGAVINLGKAGSIELAPKTTLALSFDDTKMSGRLLTGKITVLGALNAMDVSVPDGKLIKLNAGQSLLASSMAQQDDDDDDDDGGAAWWLWAAVFGGAVAGIVIAATQADNRVALGGGTTVISPNR